MKPEILPLLALLAMPAAAQERWQVGLGATYKDSSSFSPATPGGSFQRRARTAPVLQVGCQVWNSGPDDLMVTAEYQFVTRYRVDTSVAGAGESSYRMSYLAPGIAWYHAMTPAWAWGLGLQMRFAELRDSATDVRASCNRLWLDASTRYSFAPGENARPFVGLRLARALAATPSTPTLEDYQADRARAIRAGMRRLDGLWEVGLQAGVRF